MNTSWKPIPGHIMSRWAAQISPENAWQEYPRPHMRRERWLNLNGLWQVAITPRTDQNPDFAGEILVPFAMESALSGVKRPLQPDEWLWYRRTFSLPTGWEGQRILLHFGAVDWEATVWVNGKETGVHRGGYLPFHFDITDPLLTGDEGGEHEIVVRVWDPTDKHWQARGKQSLRPRGIWYAAVSGIWQTVWLEPVPQVAIRTLKLTPDIDAGVLRVATLVDGKADGLQVQATACDGEIQIAARSAEARQPLEIPIPHARLWSPSDPHLYGLQVELRANGRTIDKVDSYFGMRKFSLQADSQGRQRLCLNNQPLFQYGPLDQGYWPDGLYTPPSEAAMRSDVAFLKEIGCNMLRKHVKVEPARFYYDCDRLGLIVWQDMPNGGKAVGALLSFLAIIFSKLTRRDDRAYWRAGRATQAARDDFWRELREMVDALHHFACIAVWVPFNEGWGQFDANRVAEWLKQYDPTRLVDHASGWFDRGDGDFRSLHTYFKALTPENPDQRRAVALSEFGGYALKLDGHLWDPDAEFGYKKFDSSTALSEAYERLLVEQLTPWIEGGLSAAIYTQTSDVEIEANGYLTYDREVVKMDVEKLKAIHQRLTRNIARDAVSLP